VARLKAFKPEQIESIRRKASMTQHDFRMRFGVTQSGGSRYAHERRIPTPTAIVLWLHDAGRIKGKGLADALKAVKAAA